MGRTVFEDIGMTNKNDHWGELASSLEDVDMDFGEEKSDAREDVGQKAQASKKDKKDGKKDKGKSEKGSKEKAERTEKPRKAEKAEKTEKLAKPAKEKKIAKTAKKPAKAKKGEEAKALDALFGNGDGCAEFASLDLTVGEDKKDKKLGKCMKSEDDEIVQQIEAEVLRKEKAKREKLAKAVLEKAERPYREIVSQIDGLIQELEAEEGEAEPVRESDGEAVADDGLAFGENEVPVKKTQKTGKKAKKSTAKSKSKLKGELDLDNGSELPFPDSEPVESQEGNGSADNSSEKLDLFEEVDSKIDVRTIGESFDTSDAADFDSWDMGEVEMLDVPWGRAPKERAKAEPETESAPAPESKETASGEENASESKPSGKPGRNRDRGKRDRRCGKKHTDGDAFGNMSDTKDTLTDEEAEERLTNLFASSTVENAREKEPGFGFDGEDEEVENKEVSMEDDSFWGIPDEPELEVSFGRKPSAPKKAKEQSGSVRVSEEKTEQVSHTDGRDRGERLERSERRNRGERGECPERAKRPERACRGEQGGRTERSERPGRTGRERSERDTIQAEPVGDESMFPTWNDAIADIIKFNMNRHAKGGKGGQRRR